MKAIKVIKITMEDDATKEQTEYLLERGVITINEGERPPLVIDDKMTRIIVTQMNSALAIALSRVHK